MHDTAVAILNWNGRKLLETYLASVVEFSPQANIYLIDNASSDDSVRYVTTHFPSVKILQLNENFGFAKGYNEGLKKITEAYVVLVNSDVRVTENWLSPMLKKLASTTAVVAVQPKIKSDQLPTHFEYAGAAGGFLDWFAYPFCRGRWQNRLEEDHGQYNQETQIFWGSGACLAIKNDAFMQVGGFDEDYFAHMEEIDLCWRWNALGYEVWYTPNTEVFHFGGGTLNNASPFKTFLNFRNSLYNLLKNAPSNFIFGKILVRMILDGCIALVYLLQLKPGLFLAVLKAHLSFYANAKKMLTKRNIPNPNLRYFKTRSILWRKPTLD